MGEIFSLETSQAALAFVLGGALFLSGAFLIALVIRQYVREQSDGAPESLLAPVLAADTLDPSLRVMWVKTMLLEAEADDSLRNEAGRLARELRRCIVRAQALSVAHYPAPSDELAEVVGLALSEGIDAVRRGTSHSDLPRIRNELVKTRTALGDVPRAAEPDDAVSGASPRVVAD